MKEYYVWLTCGGAPEMNQIAAMEEYFDEVYPFEEVAIPLDEETDIIAISTNLEAEDLKADEELLTTIYTTFEETEVVDTIELEDMDLHVYRVIIPYKGDNYQVFYAMDVNA